jgi:predicted helicase
VPQQRRYKARYDSYPSIGQVFVSNSVGVVTGRDHFTISFSKEELWPRILNFSALDVDTARVAYALGNDSRDWTVATALVDVKKSGPTKNFIKELLFRPFDWRFTYYTGNSRGVYSSPQSRIMSQFLLSNLGLVVPKRVETKAPWCNAYVTNSITDHVAVSLKTIDYCFPLYLYEESGSGGSVRRSGFSRYQPMFVFEPAAAYSIRHANISSNLIISLSNAYKKQPTPEEIFHYIYAVLYSNSYRKKYAEFLKTDFPRVPFTKDYKLFNKLAEKGGELVELHLLKSKRLVNPIAKCEGHGDLRVDKVTYDQSKLRVYINPEKWFTGIPSEVWEYHIGGYQVSEKWLKDRKGRMLSSEEVSHYARVVTAISETINIQRFLDDLFSEVETSLLEVSL